MPTLSKPEACAVLGINARTMSRYLASEDPPPFTVNNRGRREFDRDEVIAWWAKPRPRTLMPKDPATGQFISRT